VLLRRMDALPHAISYKEKHLWILTFPPSRGWLGIYVEI
jgi:hypothetical protein